MKLFRRDLHPLVAPGSEGPPLGRISREQVGQVTASASVSVYMRSSFRPATAILSARICQAFTDACSWLLHTVIFSRFQPVSELIRDRLKVLECQGLSVQEAQALMKNTEIMKLSPVLFDTIAKAAGKFVGEKTNEHRTIDNFILLLNSKDPKDEWFGQMSKAHYIRELHKLVEIGLTGQPDTECKVRIS